MLALLKGSWIKSLGDTLLFGTIIVFIPVGVGA